MRENRRRSCNQPYNAFTGTPIKIAILLLATSLWTFPQPVQGKTQFIAQASLPEALVQNQSIMHQSPVEVFTGEPIKLEVKEPSNEPRIVPLASHSKRTQDRRDRPPTALQRNPQSEQLRQYSKEEVKALIISYSEQYGISPEAPLCIAQKESGFNSNSRNRNSSASGVFQYLNGTWKATDEGKLGHSVFDAEQNIKAAVKYMAIHKNTRPWTVAPSCPKLQFLTTNP